MSCYTCQSKFNWRKKELGCKSCGKAFCKDCLKQKITVPKLGTEELVCNKCFKEITTKQQKNTTQKQHGYVDNPNTYFGPSMRDIAGNQSTSTDDAIKERLKRLKDTENTNASSEKDIHQRFQQLTGRQSHASSKSNILTPQKKLTETEEIANLLKQTQEEVGIDQKYEKNDSNEDVNRKINDMEERFLRLTGIDPEVSGRSLNQGSDSSEDEYEATKRVIKKALAESQLDDKVKAEGYGELIMENKMRGKLPEVPSTAPGTKKYTFGGVNDDSEDEELPWCCICNNDATIRCHDCDDDLYCRRCFRDGHAEYDMKHHNTSSYNPPKKKR
ncbi:abscission/NoCut checkpoint regulator-like isoform X1 [Hydractinia symbiolongicarpus]|uniref:abscission/NoCut checkpoint regulator-like isoform X1 n=1 Tax=Hydractinia symbiolongicarpus TaxID=13093 RepID=UPI00254C476A|nr:abscission/NoCut checkpoint regulator-like isoform X1 [Hydractinia symbiolongicarpus]